MPQRENPIVNRLNKTKVEKYPDLKQEKDDHLRELRKKDQAAQLARVSLSFCRLNPNLTWTVVEKRGSAHRQGAPGEEVAKGSRLRRAVHRGEHGIHEQPEPGRELGGRLHVVALCFALPTCNQANKQRNLQPIFPPLPRVLALNTRPPASDPTPHLVHVCPLDLVIARVGRRLVEDIRRRPAQLHPLALEAHVRDARDVLFAVPEVVREEEGQPADGVEACSALAQRVSSTSHLQMT